MMCSCDERIGTNFLRHQLEHGTELETKKRVRTTLGFQPSVCRECRGQPLQAFPLAPLPGRTSKIRRYYWRELAFQRMERFAEWAESQGISPEDATGGEVANARKRIEQEVLTELKKLHETSPKYVFKEEPQSEIIRKYQVEVVRLDATYVKERDTKRAAILDGSQIISAEEFACRYFHSTGFETLFLESTPFHVLFGVYMWLLIQDLADPKVRMVMFGDRKAFDERRSSKEIRTYLPEDFGTPGYARRRRREIEDHLAPKSICREDLEWIFDYWLAPSENLRQYLWAHRHEDIATARKLIEKLPTDAIIKILRYLVGDYWRRYCGWPDLLVYRNQEFFFVEVKSSADKLSEDQKRWIRGNFEELQFPFKLVKIHKKSVVQHCQDLVY